MTTPTPIGSASITVEAVTDAFNRSLTADTDRVLARLQTNFEETWAQIAASVTSASHRMEDAVDRSSQAIRDEITRTSRSIEQSMERAAQRTEDSFDRATSQLVASSERSADRIEASMQDAARSMADAFQQASEESTRRVEAALREIREDMSRTANSIERDADQAGDAIGSNILQGVLAANAALGLLADGSNRALSAIGGLTAGAAKAALGLAAMAQAAAGLVATMEQLVGVVLIAPAAILSAVTVVQTLKVAFNGLGDAISAVASGDMEEINEALKELAPAARQTVQQLSGVIEGFTELGTLIQQNFFAGIADELQHFGEAALFVATSNLPKLASALGDVAEGFLEAATNSNLFEGVDAVLRQTTRGVTGLAGPVASLAPAFGDLFLVGAQYVGRMYEALGDLITRFGVFVQISAANGNLQKWIDDALAGFRQLGRILANVGGVFDTLTSSANAAGTGILDSLERITGALDEAFASDRGQSLLASSFGLLATLTDSLAIILPPVLELLAIFVTAVADGLTAALQAAQPLLRDFADVLGSFADSLPDTADSFRDFAGGGLSLFSQALDAVLPTLTEFVDTIAELFVGFDSSWLNDLVEGLQSLGSSLGGGVLDVLDSFAAVVAALGMELPTLLPILGDVAEAAGSVFATALDEAAKSVTPLTDAIEELTPGLGPLENALSGIAEVSGAVVTVLAPLVGAVGAIVAGVGQVLDPLITKLRENFAKARPDLEAVASIIGGALKKAFDNLRPGLEAFVEIAGKIIGAVAVMAPTFRQLVEFLAPLVELIGLVAGKLLEFLAPALDGVATALTTVFELFFGKLIPVFLEAATFVTDNLGPAFVAFGEIVSTVWNAIVEGVTAAVGFLVEIWNSVVTFLDETLGEAFRTLMQLNQDVWDGIVEYIKFAWGLIVEIFDTIVSVLGGYFADSWRGLETLVTEVFSAIWNYITDTIQQIIDFFTGDAARGIYDAVSGAFEGAAETALNWLNNIYNGVAALVSNVVQFFRDLPGNIGEALKDIGGFLFNLGKDIVQGLINGIIEKAKDLAGTIRDSVVEPIKDAISGVKGFFTGSPSRVTTQYGEWISEGLAIGIENMEGEVVKAAESLTQAAALPGIDMGISPVGTVGNAPLLGTMGTTGAVPVASGTLFGPGSIQVVFNGATPSEQEAYATGRAVGAGISDELSRRDARVAVGVL